MDTLTELIYYCKTKNPVGALMLTGEWGCGKTYLIKNNLRDELKDTHVIVIVSLFGLSSVSEVKEAIAQEWLDALYDEYGVWGKITDFAFKAKDTVAGAVENIAPNDTAKGVAATVKSVDLTDFRKVKNKIKDKDVVLVFDDLERSRLDTIEVLGVINDYCENKNFHTIIVAFEPKIKEDDQDINLSCREIVFDGKMVGGSRKTLNGQQVQPVQMKTFIGLSRPQGEGLSYKEIKEKIVQRTVANNPDYNKIISSIISSDLLEEGEYKQFVKLYSVQLQNLFSNGIPLNDEDIGKLSDKQADKINQGKNPHNLRSFKCAIQDFKRVYEVLLARKIPDLEEWMYAFIIYSLCSKAGLINEDSIEVFSDVNIEKTFPCFYNKKYICNFEKEWIKTGEWNEDAAESELTAWLTASKGLSSEDLVRMTRIDLLDEGVIEKGFPAVLRAAYSGELSLDDYVMIVINSRLSRHYGYALPVDIDWNQVEQGLNIRLQAMINSGEDDSHYKSMISDLKEFSSEEAKIYSIVRGYREGYGLASAQNRIKYLNALKEDSLSALMMFQDKIINSFDEELAEVAFEAFKNQDNAGKSQFVSEFKEMWSMIVHSNYVKQKETLVGLRKLQGLILDEEFALSDSKKITRSHYERFNQVLRDLIDDLSKANDSKEE